MKTDQKPASPPLSCSAISFLRESESEPLRSLVEELKDTEGFGISRNLLVLAFDPRFKDVQPETLIDGIEAILAERSLKQNSVLDNRVSEKN